MPKMLSALLVVAIAAASASAFNATDPASLQLSLFKQNTTGPIGILSLSSGCPVEYKYATSSINTNLLRNEYFIDSINHLLSERTPERVVHASGAGAFGYFEVTNDVTDLCKAKFLNGIGKKTKVAVRFSPVVPSRGSNDLAPGIRGYAIKFYTEDGNFDIPGFNVPVFITQDPVHFVSFAHSVMHNPVTNLFDSNMAWDFILKHSEAIYPRFITLTDRGIPASYTTMPGYGIHTMQLSNCNNEVNYARFYFMPDKGVKNMLPDEALQKGAKDPDYLLRDLYNNIGKGDYPSWTVYMQPLTMEDVESEKNKGFDVFDVSKSLSTKDYPLREVGKVVLNENPKNYFADVEQLAFCPGNIVPGILGAPDKMFEARAMAYRTAQAYRLGINFNKLPVNRPVCPVFTYNRDGAPTIDENEGGAPNYYPNIFNGPEPIPDTEPALLPVTELKTSNFGQVADFYENLSEDEKVRTVKRIANSFLGLIKPLEQQVLNLMFAIDKDLGNRVAQAVQNMTCST